MWVANPTHYDVERDFACILQHTFMSNDSGVRLIQKGMWEAYHRGVRKSSSHSNDTRGENTSQAIDIESVTKDLHQLQYSTDLVSCTFRDSSWMIRIIPWEGSNNSSNNLQTNITSHVSTSCRRAQEAQTPTIKKINTALVRYITSSCFMHAWSR